MSVAMSHHEPAVSVVIPAHNAARWIGETIASVAAQTIGVDRLEVIVIDDGSSDETAAIAARELAATPLRWQVLHQENRGPGHARNAGWRMARAPWIQFLDADDLLDPRKIVLQLNASSVDGTAVLYSSWRKFGLLDSSWETDDTISPHLGDDVVTDYFCGDGQGIATGSQLYRRRWLEQVGGWDEKHTNGEDHELTLRVAFAGGRFVHVASDRPLFFYRRHGPSQSTTSGRKNAEVWLRIARYVEEESRRRGELNPRRLEKIIALYGGGARWLADYDWTAAQTWIDRLFALDREYRPKWSRHFRILSNMVGFRRAVWVASRMRKVLRPRGLRPRFTTVAPPVFAVSQ
jgi:glycosyltransferase involved in cell wall biosynthesis